MDYAAIIKERVPTPELFAFYGFERNRVGFVNCPFHNEKTGSMKVYNGPSGFYCFGCGAHGDVIDFVRSYFGLSFKDAVSKINDDFRLGLPINEPIDAKRRRQMQREADERRRQREVARMERDRLYKAYDDALAEWIRLDRQRREYEPKTPSEPFHDLYIEALLEIEYAAYKLEIARAKRCLHER